MSSTYTKTSDTTVQGNAGFNASHDSADRDKNIADRDKNIADRDKNIAAGTNDYTMHQGGAEGVNKNVSEDKNKHEKTVLTFERKKVVDEDKDISKDVNKDTHMKDVSAKKDVSSKKEASGESKGFINTIKEKVMDVLGSGDNDKEKDKDFKNKDLKNKDWEKKDKKLFSEPEPVGTSSQQHYSSLGATSGQQHASLGSSNIGSDKYVSTSSEKYTAHSGLAGNVDHQPATIDRSGLGAEHKELGYDKYSSVVPNKSVDMEKDSGHKLDIHASVKTGSAGSTSGSQASTYKTTESK